MSTVIDVVTREVVATYRGAPVYAVKFAYQPYWRYDGEKQNAIWNRKFVAPRARAWEKAGGCEGALTTLVLDEGIDKSKPLLIQRYLHDHPAHYDDAQPFTGVAIAQFANTRGKVAAPLLPFDTGMHYPRCIATVDQNVHVHLHTKPDAVMDLTEVNIVMEHILKHRGLVEIYGATPASYLYDADGVRYRLEFDAPTCRNHGEIYPVVGLTFDPKLEGAA